MNSYRDVLDYRENNRKASQIKHPWFLWVVFIVASGPSVWLFIQFILWCLR